MKAKFTLLVIIGVLLSSCGAQTATEETEVVTEPPTTQVAVIPLTLPAAVATEELIATEPATEVPTDSPITCVTLLEPVNGIDLPITGKVTFSWTPIDEAGSYVLNFMLPSGAVASFETDQTFRDRYMEAFVSGGEYQWQVIAQGSDGGEICVSKAFTFDKPAYVPPEQPKGDGNDRSGGGDDWTPPPPITSVPD